MKKYFWVICFLFVAVSSAWAKSEAFTLPSDVMSSLNKKFSEPKVIDHKKMGNLEVVHLSVKGADHSDAFVIITPDNKVVNIDDYAILSGINIKKASNFKTLAEKNPNIDSLWPGNHQYPENVILPGGIQQLQFTYSVLNGCHACAIGAIAKVGFNFDTQGNFLGTTLLGLSPPPVVGS